MSDSDHPVDRISFAVLYEIIETEYVLRKQESGPVPSMSHESLCMFAHNLRATLRRASDLGIIEAGRAGFPIPTITAYAADAIKRAEMDEANGPGYWDGLDTAPQRSMHGRMARVLRDRMNLALSVLSPKFRVGTLPQPPPEQAEYWKRLDTMPLSDDE